jgi:hypothetical protein
MFLPEVERIVEKGDTVNVEVVLLGDFSDDADFGFAKRDERAQGHLLLGNEFMGGENASTVETEDDGACFFGEDAAFGVTTEQDDWSGFSNAAAVAETDVVILASWRKGQGLIQDIRIAKWKAGVGIFRGELCEERRRKPGGK